MAAYELIDVEGRHREHPDTFEILSLDARSSLRVGDLAKLIFNDEERMWVRVWKVSAGLYDGVLVSDPIMDRVRKGDVVEFGPRHVLDVEERTCPCCGSEGGHDSLDCACPEWCLNREED